MAVVVGVDGSEAALRAALWAVDEAVSRDVSLYLVCAIHQPGVARPTDAARELATAEIALRDVVMAVQATDKPVKVEAQIVLAPPRPTLVQLSRAAAMVCIGAIGCRHLQAGGVGSTATGLAASAHCPVAIVGGHRRAAGGNGCIVVRADEWPDDGVVLEHAMQEARLRAAPLRVIGFRGSVSSEGTDGVAGGRQLSGRLRRRLQTWSRSYPDVDMELFVVRAGIVDYLAKEDHPVQLVVVNARNRRDVDQLLGGGGKAALGQHDCSVLLVGQRSL